MAKENLEPLNDPVCGFRFAEGEETLIEKHNGVQYRLCGKWCAGRFKKNPSRYLGEPIIKLRGVTKKFGEGNAITHVLKGIDLNIWEGDFVSLIGASGSGKSTLLNLIGNLDVATEGEVFIKGRAVSGLSDEDRAELRSNTFGFVFQQYNLIPWLSAIENVSLPVIFAGKQRQAKEKAIRESFSSIGLAHRLEHRPTQLSGGEQQRVALLRALANDPGIILGDEPTGNLDSKTGEKILKILQNINNDDKKTLVIVTHDKLIAALADHTFVLKDGLLVKDHTAWGGVYTGNNK